MFGSRLRLRMSPDLFLTNTFFTIMLRLRRLLFESDLQRRICSSLLE